MISVVIVDDHPVVRAGIRKVLEATGDVVVIADGTTGSDALRLVAEHRPAVLVLDVNLPDLDGVEVTRRLRQQGMTTPILILTVHHDRETIFGLLESGATGYVLKDEAPETLVSAVRAAARGQPWLSPEIARQVVDRAFELRHTSAARPPLPITPRETEILCLLAQGLDNTEIAEHLTLTTRTVQNHVSAIYAKLGVDSRTEAALAAIRHGLVRVSRTEGEDDQN